MPCPVVVTLVQEHGQNRASSAKGHWDGRIWGRCPVRRGWGIRDSSAWIRHCLAGTTERSAALHYLWGKVLKKMEKGYSQWCMAGGQENISISLNKRYSNLFPIRTVKQWDILWLLSVEFFKTELHKALRNLNWPHSWLFELLWAETWAKDLQNFAMIPMTWLTAAVTFPVLQIFP